jgi:bifunctional UDP-N-acetylglucosamine pyrophosphorylase/glucosamine-1-phosphate N-acetyltransferase
MRSDKPKVLHEVASAPLLIHAMKSAEAIAPERRVIVAGFGFDAVKAATEAYDPEAHVVLQAEQNGTGHAVDQARDALADFDGTAIVLFADTPFIQPETLRSIEAKLADGADVVVLGFEAEVPGGYGRLVMDGDDLDAIVEAKDASPEQLEISFCNSGVMAAKSDLMFSLISDVGTDNAQGEYYLTSIVGIARERGLTCKAVACPEAETLGINSRANLAEAEAVFQSRARAAAMANGATLIAPETVFFAHDTRIGRDVVIEPNVYFAAGVSVEDGVTIRANSHLEGCTLRSGATVGPYARLRPGADIGESARIGNFVEVKAAEIGKGAKVNHLSYVGDASVGEKANIGAGTITCNYDGVFKHRTEIGKGAFVGSNASLVAPVVIGDEAMIGSGSVISKSVPDGDLALGRARQENKTGWGKKFMDALRAKKAALKK